MRNHHLITRHISAGIPSQDKTLIFTIRRKILGNIHIRLGNTIFHAVYKFYFGYLCKIVVFLHAHNFQRHFFHCDLGSEIYTDCPTRILLYIHGAGIKQKIHAFAQWNYGGMLRSFFCINNLNLRSGNSVVCSGLNHDSVRSVTLFFRKLKLDEYRRLLGNLFTVFSR